MGSFRFYRRIKVLPGVSLNLSKSGPSLSFGVRGAHVTVGRNGIRRTVGIPGTGIYYTSVSGHHTGFHSAHRETSQGPTGPDRAAGWIFITAILFLIVLESALSAGR
jgi:hypothetical protein